ncbi:type I secretion C-terminal target domain-containing protein [Comamonas aquatica]|uniref:type I secretion C-terminal target domain-containing protein n=1 Tax=Comamonas aquatica TaxID=225991 RepID=UPI002448130E|nr:type I secretion C-terminal target domain-containing protein [Comamonas aquatica]MDH1673485.1 type I secretion C-terminal target domain-containing protein [Comamonas aquatica]MDH1676600.1 type I secretion C-terminal target domain-containing protein [Comamonas aquatica]
MSGNVLANDPGYAAGNGALIVSDFTVNGVVHNAGSSSVAVTEGDNKVVVGHLVLQANGNYSFTPTKDWSGTVPTVNYTTSTGQSSTLNITVTPVTDTPTVVVTTGAGTAPQIISIDTSTVLQTNPSGHKVTAVGRDGKPATISVVTQTDHDGFGVSGSVSSVNTGAADSEIGTGEKLRIDFYQPVTSITAQFAWLNPTEWARYQLLDGLGQPVKLGFNADGTANSNGVYGFVKGGTDKVETEFILSVPAGQQIGAIVFDALRNTDDYLVHKVTYTTGVSYPVTISVTPTDVDFSESVTQIKVTVPAGVTLSGGTVVAGTNGTEWLLPLDSTAYTVSTDPTTGAVTISGLNMVVPDNVTNATIAVTGTVQDGTAEPATGSASTTAMLVVNDVASASLTATTVSDKRGTPLAEKFSGNETWAWDTAKVNAADTSIKALDWVTSAASSLTKWVSNESLGSKSSSEFRLSSGAVALQDANSSSTDTRLLTPVYTAKTNGEKLTFTASISGVKSGDSYQYQLYANANDGNGWKAVGSPSTLGTTNTTSALAADTQYRIYINVNDKTSSITLAVSVDNFKVLAPDAVQWAATATTGNVLFNDHSATGTLQVLKNGAYQSVSSGTATIEGTYGTLVINSTGAFTYTPSTAPTGSVYQTSKDVFTYKVGDSAPATLTVTVNASGTGVLPGAAPTVESSSMVAAENMMLSAMLLSLEEASAAPDSAANNVPDDKSAEASAAAGGNTDTDTAIAGTDTEAQTGREDEQQGSSSPLVDGQGVATSVVGSGSNADGSEPSDAVAAYQQSSKGSDSTSSDGMPADLPLAFSTSGAEAARTDSIVDGSKAAHIVSTKGNDWLLGSDGDDLFIWNQGDEGTTLQPATDTVKDFGKSGNDQLVLGDLLQGEEEPEADLSKFLHIEKNGEDTVVKISTDGELEPDGGKFNQAIVLKDVDLVGSAAFESSADQNALIKQLIQQGKIAMDGNHS